MKSGTHTKITLLVAAALLAVYLLAVYSQWAHVGADNVAWARRSELLSGLEALAVAAAGVLLGTAVQRTATSAAQSDAERARRRAGSAELGEREAQVMRAMLEARTSVPSEMTTSERFGDARVASEEQDSATQVLAEVLAAADSVRTSTLERKTSAGEGA